MTSEGFKKARKLVIGERIEKSEEGYEIVEKKVYNLEVEEYHTFYISEGEVLVQNEYKNLKLEHIYSKYYEGIPDEKLKAEFKSTIEELDKLDPVKNKEIIDNFHASFAGIKSNEAGGIRDILSKVPKVAGKARKLDIAKDADIILDVKSIRQSLPSRYKTSGNLATAEVNVDGISQNKFFAHSSIDKMQDNLVGKADNISLQLENPMFKATKAANKNGDIYLRDSCTEYKILNDIANRLKDNVDASGKIKLVTELKPCDSCKNVIDNFRSTFKNIEIEVIHNDNIRIIPKNGY